MNRPDISRLQKNRAIFLKIGVIAALGFVIFAFSWTTSAYLNPNYQVEALVTEDALEVIRTAQDPPRLPPPPLIEPVSEPLFDDLELTTEPEPELVEANLAPDPSSEPVELAIVPAKRPVKTPEPLAPPEKPKEIDLPFVVVEEMPRFPGCETMKLTTKEKKECADKKLLEYVYNRVRYPALARENGVEGTAQVRFVIERDGSITDVEIIKDPGGGCGREVVRVVNEMPQWSPGKQRGKPVRVQCNLPVKFRLSK